MPAPTRSCFSALFALALLPGSAAVAQTTAPTTITVQVGQPGPPVPKNMFGLFFEDINFAADGGIYPELVKNRSFEIDNHLLGWRALNGGAALSAYTISTDKPLHATTNRHYVRLTAPQASPDAGLLNDGFRGMGVKAGADYNLSLYARRGTGGVTGLRVTLEDEKGNALATSQLTGLTDSWRQLTAVLRPSATVPNGHLKITLEGAGTVDLDVVSLYPQDTWLSRPNGLRTDLVRLLKDMRPGFLRFPGGCIVEGRTLDERYQWKETIGDVAARVPLVNRWNMEFRHRATPDYYQSFGLGFYEYFQLAEDIGAEPLPILNVGMACQFNSAELAPLSAAAPGGPNAAPTRAPDEPTMETFIQDALDLVEFANGPTTSPWGSKRAAMGHPKPFNLKMIGVGNEQWGPQYLDRYALFAKALQAKYPNIELVGAAGPSPAGDLFELATKRLRELKVDYIDEHYYAKPEWFRANVHRYDDYPRTGTKIFAGEYAAQSVGVGSPDNRNTWDCAISEAAFLTGLERNAAVVSMASYAPLFAHVDAWQWRPDLIWFDNLTAYGTPSYYVQQLFSLNKGTTTLPVQQPNGADNLFSSAVADATTNDVVVKLVNYSAAPRPVRVQLSGLKKIGRTGRATVLTSSDLQTENSLKEPLNLAPKTETFRVTSPTLAYTLAPYSCTVLRVGRK